MEIVGVPVHTVLAYAAAAFGSIGCLTALWYAVRPERRDVWRYPMMITATLGAAAILGAYFTGERLLSENPSLAIDADVTSHQEYAERLVLPAIGFWVMSVLGMILSTLPAAFLALKIGGVTKVLWLVVGILIIHAVEAYMLNPLIYGRHLRLHPVAVLLILIVAEHLFGVWGLLLGVPIAAFVLKYVIEGQPITAPAPRDATSAG